MQTGAHSPEGVGGLAEDRCRPSPPSTLPVPGPDLLSPLSTSPLNPWPVRGTAVRQERMRGPDCLG